MLHRISPSDQCRNPPTDDAAQGTMPEDGQFEALWIVKHLVERGILVSLQALASATARKKTTRFQRRQGDNR